MELWRIFNYIYWKQTKIMMKKKIYFMKMKKKIKNIKYYDFVSNLPNIPALFITKKIIEPF